MKQSEIRRQGRWGGSHELALRKRAGELTFGVQCTATPAGATRAGLSVVAVLPGGPAAWWNDEKGPTPELESEASQAAKLV